MKRRDTGIRGENIARDFLKKRGFRILETNYRCPRGEIDIIARHHDYLVFIEVRTKTGTEFGSPEESITQTKKKHLKTTALYYIERHTDLPSLYRIDVVAIEMDKRGKPLRITLIDNAVGEG